MHAADTNPRCHGNPQRHPTPPLVCVSRRATCCCGVTPGRPIAAWWPRWPILASRWLLTRRKPMSAPYDRWGGICVELKAICPDPCSGGEQACTDPCFAHLPAGHKHPHGPRDVAPKPTGQSLRCVSMCVRGGGGGGEGCSLGLKSYYAGGEGGRGGEVCRCRGHPAQVVLLIS